MNNLNDVRCFLVRTIPELVEKSIIGIGWSDFDFSEIKDAEDAVGQINDSYGIGRSGNQIRRFFSIQDGDLIVAPLPYSVAIGVASGGMFYDVSYYDKDRTNQRRVVFPRNEEGQAIRIPRDSFSEAFQRRLRVMGMTVNDLSEFQNEIVDAYEKVSAGKDFSWSLVIAERIESASITFKDQLLGNIQSGNTNLQTGGVGLEYLVKELLEIEGYQADVMSKRAFPGNADADVKASRTDPCALVNLLVQVKHHQGFSHEYGLAQLEEIRKAELPEWDDHQLVFCTSASVSKDFGKRAEEQNIKVIDGEALVDWIYQHIDVLSKTTKSSLGICEVPTVLKMS